MWNRAKIWIPSLLILAVAAFFLSLVFFAVQLFIHSKSLTEFNLNDGPTAELLKADPKNPLLLASGAVVGIFSKIVFDLLSATDEIILKLLASRLSLFRSILRGLFFPLMITPIVLMSLYGKLDASNSDLLNFLFAYQSGFFFQSIVGRELTSTNKQVE
ncbi:hypothetical protein [Bradyrhizobium sp. 199]|uniref:hypothetical protein n=1 Tax=Bradyrhizobium sp. 199 TaxID=2782664 RepID=UPI001FF8BC19|nr:hypothetical protein [Bradyrhizobium sp. 199]MCK1357353.1 hypothetical protein [Bradyrhizobium sp. 199]